MRRIIEKQYSQQDNDDDRKNNNERFHTYYYTKISRATASARRERAFAAQELDLFARATGVTARRAIGTNHSVTWHPRHIRIIVHDVPHRAVRVRPPRAARDLFVRHRAPGRDLCHHGVYFLREGFHISVKDNTIMHALIFRPKIKKWPGEYLPTEPL